MTTTLLLVRHGETEFNTRGIYQGQADSPLTAEGITQARSLGPRLARLGTCQKLYASDLRRAEHTAELIGTPGHHQIVTDAGLRERNYGVFQGKKKKTVASEFPDVWKAYRSGNPDYVIPDGESHHQFHDRVVEALNRIADQHRGQAVAAVSHGGTLGVFMKYVLGLAVEGPRPFDIGNTSLSIVERRKGKWKIRTLGEMAHLQDIPPANQTEG